MNLEDHILWKIVTAYDLLYKMRKKFTAGDLAWEEYAAIMEPKCKDIMQVCLDSIERGDFLEWHRRNIENPEAAPFDPYGNPRKFGYPFKSTSEYVIERYDQFVEVYRSAMIETNPEKRTRELVVGMDSFVGWMHGSFELSIKVIRENPLTGDPKIDYEIALHTMYLVTYKFNADDAIKYLREKTGVIQTVHDEYPSDMWYHDTMTWVEIIANWQKHLEFKYKHPGYLDEITPSIIHEWDKNIKDFVPIDRNKDRLTHYEQFMRGVESAVNNLLAKCTESTILAAHATGVGLMTNKEYDGVLKWYDAVSAASSKVLKDARTIRGWKDLSDEEYDAISEDLAYQSRVLRELVRDRYLFEREVENRADR